jgi:glycosyl transferase family 25
MNSIHDIQHVFYINLDTRPDRKAHVERQLQSIGITNAQRFKAIKLHNGALGCSMSHLKLLETAKQNNWDHILIVEDDIQFLKPNIFKKQMNSFLQKHTKFDVLLLGGNNMPPFEQIDDTCVKVSRCQTTTGYLVKNHYFDTLIHNYRNGMAKLLKEPQNHVLFAIDKYWFTLQSKHDWYLLTPLTVTQREDYSDIEKRATNYSRAMLDLDKTEFIRTQKMNYIKNQLNKLMHNL